MSRTRWIYAFLFFLLDNGATSFSNSIYNRGIITHHHRKPQQQKLLHRRSVHIHEATGDATGEAMRRNLTRVPAFVYSLNSSTKWLVTIAHTLAVWSRPHAFIGPFIVVGSIGSVYLTSTLKKIVNQERPAGAPFTDPGMPSSHALVSFFAASAWMSVVASPVGKIALAGAAGIVSVLRVACGYHSVAQIAVGATVGSFLGHVWFLTGCSMNAASPQLLFYMAWGSYLGGSAFFIMKNMRHWVGKDAHT